MTKWLFVSTGTACLAGSAFFFKGQIQHYVLVGILLFWPLLDPHWRPPRLSSLKLHRITWIVIICFATVLLVLQPQYLSFALTSLLFAALPEEWFFRGYLLVQIQRYLNQSSGYHLHANLLSSLVFSLIHGLTQNWVLAGLVFFPSLVFGWLYQRSRDIVLVILIHALSNLVFIMFIKKQLSQWV